MPFENLPGIFETKLDGSLTIPATNDSPIVCVLGTSAQGEAEELFTVVRASDAARVFGKEGTVARGMYEASSTGATNLRLFRIGATAAKIVGLGGGDGIVETLEKDDAASSNYGIWFDSGTGRLRVYRAADAELVFDSGDGTAGSAVDLGEVSVDDVIAGGTTVGSSASDTVLLKDVPSIDVTVALIDGTDGLNLNRMEMYEALDQAYSLLEDAELDIVVPMNVYLDDKNVMDMTLATVSGLMTGITGHDDIVAGGAKDALGLLFKEEFEGEVFYFWDVDRDGVAEIVPTVPGIDPAAQLLIDGGTHSIAAAVASGAADLTAGSFHEVNFAYQLATFCFRQSHLNTEMHGVIGVRPPKSFSPKDLSQWIGQSPLLGVDANGSPMITKNGKGLLGNKWMAGRRAEGGLSAHLIAGDALPDGGFIATDDGWLDGIHQRDSNDALVDIGKYLDIVSRYPLLVNPSQRDAYTASGAASYAGLQTTLRPASAATNKVVRNVSLPYRINNSKVDQLAGKRYVEFLQKAKGIVVADAPTAARPDSDYNRRSTMAIVKASIDVVRIVGEPFLGEGLTGAQMAAAETAISQALSELVKAGVLVRFEMRVSATALERRQGKLQVSLVLVPAFELRQINVSVALAAA